MGDDDKTPMTVANFKEFLGEFAKQLAASPPLQVPRLGDVVPADEVISLHSESLCEDGITTLRLWDLRDGYTGSQSFPVGSAPGPIHYC